MKKLLAILLVIITILFSSCSKERKFGIQQFVERINKTYETTLKTDNLKFSRRGEENFLFMNDKNTLYSFFIDTDNNIKGINLLITADGNIENAKNTYCQMCSIFTGNDFDSQMALFKESELFNNIKFADGNAFITVGRFRYTIVSNQYSITFICDRV